MGARPRDPVTLPAFLDGLAARFGEREALVSARRRVTYAELAAESTAIARGLAARGVERGTRVGLLMPNWPEWIATAFGVWRAGGLLVPLSTLNRPREMAYCLAHAEVRVLVAVRRFLRHDYMAGLEEGAPRLPALREVVWLAPPGEGGAVDLAPLGAPGSPLAATVSPDDPATVFFAWPHQAEVLIGHPRFRAARLVLRKGVGANAKWAAALYPPDHHAVGTYGMTETLPLCTAWPWDAPLALRAASHGPPVGGKEIRIVDPETGRTLPAGREGEIYVRGPTLFAHYYRHSPAECFDAEGFFHTGDLGQLDERGALHFRGRLKDVIKTAGVNVAAAEVEAALLAHPAVGAAHVVGVPDPARGENVAAFVVAKSAVAAEALLAHCRAWLSSYKVPRHLWLRREDELPEKASGKVDKSALRAEAARLVRAAGDPPGSPPARRA